MNEIIRHIYAWLLATAAFIGIWFYGLMAAWPWEPSQEWKAQYIVAAQCKTAQGPESCTLPYGAIQVSRQEGVLLSLTDIPAFGEHADTQSWHQWRKVEGQPWEIELTWSSWDFKESVRYRIENDEPVLLEHRHVGPFLMAYAIPLALLTVGLLILRKLLSLRRKH